VDLTGSNIMAEQLLTEPTVQGYPTDTSTKTVNISLSAMQEGGLTVVIAGRQKINPSDSAALILGSDRENPGWETPFDKRPPMGDWQDPEDPKPKTEDTLMTLPKEALKGYADKEVQLRYRTSGESGLYSYSKPITLRVEP
jgi:hypothetical protein